MIPIPYLACEVQLSFKLVKRTTFNSHSKGSPDLLKFIMSQEVAVSCDLKSSKIWKFQTIVICKGKYSLE